jgi:hypothetical protein
LLQYASHGVEFDWVNCATDKRRDDLGSLGRPLDHLDLANWITRFFKHFGQKVPDLADGLRVCHNMDLVDRLRLPLVDRGAVDGIDEWSQESVARKDCDGQDRGLRREPDAGQCLQRLNTRGSQQYSIPKFARRLS